jgi:histidinol phosphatase-like enzyme
MSKTVKNEGMVNNSNQNQKEENVKQLKTNKMKTMKNTKMRMKKLGMMNDLIHYYSIELSENFNTGDQEDLQLMKDTIHDLIDLRTYEMSKNPDHPKQVFPTKKYIYR